MKPTYVIVIALLAFLFIFMVLLAIQKDVLAAFMQEIRPIFR